MAKAEPLPYEKWVTKFVENVATYFNFGGWHIDVKFHDEEKETAYAETSIDFAYQSAIIHFYKSAKSDFEEGRIHRLTVGVLHELVHIFVNPFHSWAEPHLSKITEPYFMDILEQQTQRLTMVFLKNLPKGLLPPR